MTPFDIRVDRSGMTTVKQQYTPKVVADSGIISLWGAEFEFPTAQFVVDAVVEWAKKGLYAYTVEDDNFRDLVCRWMKDFRRWEIRPEWIVPVYGITASLAVAMRAFTKPGDGIIALDPIYHMYWHATELSGRRKVSCPLLFDGDCYRIDWMLLESLMGDPRNRMMVVCNPHNPIGKVYSAEDLSRIADLAARHDVILFNDEIFAECIYDGVRMTTFGQLPTCRARVITATSIGKWLSFTGTNQANLIIPDEELRAAFIAERDRDFYGSMNPIMIPAYRAAYTPQGAAWIGKMMAYIQENYRFVDDFFRRYVPEFHAVKPEGTFILWVDARKFCADEERLIAFLTEKAHFHVDPGSTYHAEPGFFRMTLSVPRKELEKALYSLRQAYEIYKEEVQ